MTNAGKIKTVAEIVPAAEAMVCTMLFSRTLLSLKKRNIAMDITAAGIDVAKVKPTFKPK